MKIIKLPTKLVVIPGWTYSRKKMLPLAQRLQRDDREVQILSVPGLTGPPLTRAWTLSDYGRWLEQEVDRISQGNQPVILLGHSNGGRIALKYLATTANPTQVVSLILIGAAGLVDRQPLKRLKRYVWGNLAQAGKRLKKNQTARRLVYALIRERDYQEATPVMRQTMANLINEDLRPDLGRVKTKTLLIWGDGDRDTPLYLGRELKQRLSQAQLQVIAGARHAPHVSHTDEVAALINEFLK
jgi:pimeloyl-ACP methyl ester carboxylesterase